MIQAIDLKYRLRENVHVNTHLHGYFIGDTRITHTRARARNKNTWIRAFQETGFQKMQYLSLT